MPTFRPRTPPRRPGRWLVLPLLPLIASSPVLAQNAAPRARTDALFYLGVDVATATVSGLLQGRTRKIPLKRAIIGGFAGGAVVYAGQRLVGTGEPALRFVGLQTVAVGASLTRNLSQGHRPLEELTLPIFPLYVQLHLDGRPRVSARLSAVAVGGIVHSAREFHVWPDWRQSLVAGLPVFAVPDPHLATCGAFGRGGECHVMGHHVIGAVAYSGRPIGIDARAIITHELGHSAQDARDAVLHAAPASDYVLGKHPVGRFLARFLVLDVMLPLNLASRAAGPRTGDPACRELATFYECETEAMIAR